VGNNLSLVCLSAQRYHSKKKDAS